MSPDLIYIIEVAVQLSRESAKFLTNVSNLRPPEKNQKGIVEVIPFTFECITAVSTIRLKLPENLKNPDAKQSVLKTMEVIFIIKLDNNT